MMDTCTQLYVPSKGADMDVALHISGNSLMISARATIESNVMSVHWYQQVVLIFQQSGRGSPELLECCMSFRLHAISFVLIQNRCFSRRGCNNSSQDGLNYICHPCRTCVRACGIYGSPARAQSCSAAGWGL